MSRGRTKHRFGGGAKPAEGARSSASEATAGEEPAEEEQVAKSEESAPKPATTVVAGAASKSGRYRVVSGRALCTPTLGMRCEGDLVTLAMFEDNAEHLQIHIDNGTLVKA